MLDTKYHEIKATLLKDNNQTIHDNDKLAIMNIGRHNFDSFEVCEDAKDTLIELPYSNICRGVRSKSSFLSCGKSKPSRLLGTMGNNCASEGEASKSKINEIHNCSLSNAKANLRVLTRQDGKDSIGSSSNPNLDFVTQSLGQRSVDKAQIPKLSNNIEGVHNNIILKLRIQEVLIIT